MLFLKEEFNIQIDSFLNYKSITEVEGINKQVNIETKKFKKIHTVGDLQFGDVLVFKVHGKFDAHCGVYLGEDFIHTNKQSGVMKSCLYLESWLKRFSFGIRVLCK